MSEISELILLLNKQHQEQMAVLRGEHQEQMTMLQEQKIFAATVKNVFSPKYQLITWVTLYQVEELQKGPKLMPY